MSKLIIDPRTGQTVDPAVAGSYLQRSIYSAKDAALNDAVRAKRITGAGGMPLNPMAIKRTIERKAPSQAPTAFFECKQSGGAHGSASKAPEKSTSGPMREKIYGRKSLAK